MNTTQVKRMRRPRSTRSIGGAVLALSLVAATSSFQLQPSPLSSHPILHQNNPLAPSPGQLTHGRQIRPSQIRQEATSLNSITPAAALSAVGSPLGSIAVLAFVILVHESGHFLAARSLGINVDEFSVGVGPRLVGVRRRLVDDKFVFDRIEDGANKGEDEVVSAEQLDMDDGIEFSLRAIPLGGYVRFPENYNRTLAFEQDDVARKARYEARLMRLEGASTLEKALESMAAKSFTLNLLSLGLLGKWQSKREEDQLKLAEEELGSSKMAKMNGSKGGGSWLSALPWVSNNKKDDDEEMSISDKLSILRAAKTPEVAYFEDPNLLQNRPWNERAIVLSGGVAFNILLALACYFGELTVGRGLPSPVFDAGAVVSQVPGQDSPSFGLLKRGDVIVGVNDVVTLAANSKKGMFSSQKEISSVISTIRETPDGETVKLTIVHGKNTDSTDTISITPRRNTEGIASIGVMLGPNYVRTDVIKASSLVDAASKAGTAVYDLTSETARSIVGLLLGFIVGKGVPAGTSMSGPIGVVKTGAEVVKSSDFAAVVAFAASISINLAVVNSLPLPALDGGQLVFVLAEAAAGRKIDQRAQEAINTGALLFLLLISAGTAVGDVTSIFR